ncbi:cytochrome P450 [Bacillus sp. REN10]|uniref:cytochrome P450 n=1 Tax=Bacillus sp. REN10 TaxID=2782541 RepID=UPI00193AE0E7|nr:cytochrome P450 [Bacillus sp. REN10]
MANDVLVSPAMLASPQLIENPYPIYDELRSQSPIMKGTALKQPGWYVTGYEEAAMILKDPRFENRIPLPQTTKKFAQLKNVQNDMLLFKNDQDHRRLRLLMSPFFTPAALNDLCPYIEKTAHDLVDDVYNQKRMDIIADFAFPLASLIIAKIIGIPAEDRWQFRGWAISLIESIDFTRSRKTLLHGNETMKGLIDYFNTLIQKRRQSPENDFISQLLEAQQNDQLSNEEILSACILLVIAGHETTVNLISNSVLALLRNREQLQLLKKQPSLMESAVEEFLRYESPTQMVARVAGDDIHINNVCIEQGEQVYILIGAANRDSAKFAHPNVLDITRNPNPHLAFGIGSHFCIGAMLAKLEAKMAILPLIQRLEHLQLETQHLQWRNLVGFRALDQLMVRWG